jgi:hypothetical protein
MSTNTKKTSAREVVESTPQPPPPPPSDSATEKPKAAPVSRKKKVTVYEFVKNINPSEKIILKGHDHPFTFPSNPFHTSDEELAEQLREVAGAYAIFENESSQA